MPFASNTKNKMIKALTEALDDQIQPSMGTIRQGAKDAVKQLDVVDSAATANATDAEYIKRGDDRTLTFFTPTTVTDRRGTYYPVFPFYGWSTSRKFGPRNWLRLGAAKAMQAIGFNGGSLPNPNQTFRK